MSPRVRWGLLCCSCAGVGGSGRTVRAAPGDERVPSLRTRWFQPARVFPTRPWPPRGSSALPPALRSQIVFCRHEEPRTRWPEGQPLSRQESRLTTALPNLCHSPRARRTPRSVLCAGGQMDRTCHCSCTPGRPPLPLHQPHAEKQTPGETRTAKPTSHRGASVGARAFGEGKRARRGDAASDRESAASPVPERSPSRCHLPSPPRGQGDALKLRSPPSPRACPQLREVLV